MNKKGKKEERVGVGSNCSCQCAWCCQIHFTVALDHTGSKLTCQEFAFLPLNHFTVSERFWVHQARFCSLY